MDSNDEYGHRMLMMYCYEYYVYLRGNVGFYEVGAAGGGFSVFISNSPYLNVCDDVCSLASVSFEF